MANKEYTCHNCSHVFETWPDQMKEAHNNICKAAEGVDVFPDNMCQKCPNCDEVYYLDLTTDPPTLVP